MKSKTIEKILTSKFKKFVNSIEDENVKKLVSENSLITGGAIASLFLTGEVNDYDIYFTNRETAIVAANYYVNKFNEIQNTTKSDTNQITIRPVTVVEKEDRIQISVKSAGIATAVSDEKMEQGYQYFEGDRRSDAPAATEYVENLTSYAKIWPGKGENKFKPIFLSSNAITLSDDVQLIFRFYGDPQVIHDNYDFVHCTNYWLSKDSKLVLNQPAPEALMSKELKYIGSKYPICSIIRLRKFLKRDFTITAGHLLKILWQVADLDLNDPYVLEEQLVGVDAAYFNEIIIKLKENLIDGKINNAYLFELIDKIF